MLDKIAIQNFRIFKEETSFDLKPITILTGPNNAGKSSLIKFLLLIKEGLNKLNFEHGEHNLESFDKVLNWENTNDKIKFRFNYEEDSEVEFTYEMDYLTTIKVFKDDIELFEFYEYVGDWQKDNNDTYQKLKNININYYIDKLYNLTNSNLSSKNLEFSNDLKNLNKDYLLYNLNICGVNMTTKYKEKLLAIQNSIYSEWETHIEDPDSRIQIFESLQLVLKWFKEAQLKTVSKHFQKELGTEDIEIIFSPLGRFIFESKYRTGHHRTTGEDTFFELFKDKFEAIPNKINTKTNWLHYLQANRGNQKRVLENKSESAIDEIILEFSKSKYIQKEFIKKAFEIIGIKGELIVERYQNVISVVYLKTKNGNIALADLGFGYSQLIPIILKINNIHSFQEEDMWDLWKEKDITINKLILEEPEANLHPNLQSKLADLLVLAYKSFRLGFIIETHSEYFIRKLQYLTAKKDISPDNSVIYYFNADEFVTSKEPKVKEIQINETGGLTDSFGPGFYDEATRLQFDLIKINQDQIN